MNSERTTTTETIVISDMTREQIEALFSGSMTWEEAHRRWPGKPLVITEVESEELEEVGKA
jgi:hypothetical protein